MNIAQLLIDQAQRQADIPAIIETVAGQTRSIRFRELDQRSAEVAALFRQVGLTAGDPVLIFQGMSIGLYVVLIACFRLGLIATFLDPGVGKAQLEACCQRIQPAAFVGAAKAHGLRLLSRSMRAIPLGFSTGIALPWTDSLAPFFSDQAFQKYPQHLNPWTEIWDCPPETPALLTFTSGSTSQPKAAVRSHQFLLAQYDTLLNTIQLRAGQIDLATLPIFALANLAAGLTTLIPDADLRRPGRIKPAPVVRQILKDRPTRAAASPAFLEQLIRYCQQTHTQLESLTQIYTGGAPVFPCLLDHLHQMAPNADIAAIYGSTEAEPIAHIHHHQITASDITRMYQGHGLLAGLPVDQIQLKILPSYGDQPIPAFTQESFAATCLPLGETGEIVVTGDHVLQGYLDGIGDIQTKFKVGEQIWHRTGDAGYLDDQGRLWLLGRDRAQIQDDRGRIYPFAVECAVTQMDQVHRSALIQHQDQRVLVVELCQPGGAKSPRDRIMQIEQNLSWANLDYILIVDRVPVDRRHNAKVDYPGLKQLVNRQFRSAIALNQDQGITLNQD